MSSENPDVKTGRRKSKVSWGRLIRPGLVGPKPRPKGVGDGEFVNIRTPPVWCLSSEAKQKVRPSRGKDVRVQTCSPAFGGMRGVREPNPRSGQTGLYHAAKKNLWNESNG
jgi:hypothetical protein